MEDKRDKLNQHLTRLIESLDQALGVDMVKTWYVKKQKSLMRKLSEKTLRKILKDLDRSLCGMGSVTDMPLKPKKRSRFQTEEELFRTVVGNATALSDEIDRALKKLK